MSFPYDYNTKCVEDPKDVPTTPHHLIIVWEEVLVDDGWGGNYKRSFARTYVFTDVVEWERAVKDLALDEGQGYPKQKPKFMAYKDVRSTIIAIRAEVTIG